MFLPSSSSPLLFSRGSSSPPTPASQAPPVVLLASLPPMIDRKRITPPPMMADVLSPLNLQYGFCGRVTLQNLLHCILKSLRWGFCPGIVQHTIAQHQCRLHNYAAVQLIQPVRPRSRFVTTQRERSQWKQYLVPPTSSWSYAQLLSPGVRLGGMCCGESSGIR